jgi:hypothetical protein
VNSQQLFVVLKQTLATLLMCFITVVVLTRTLKRLHAPPPPLLQRLFTRQLVRVVSLLRRLKSSMYQIA